MKDTQHLRDRWIGQEERIEAIILDIQSKKDWTGRLIGTDCGGTKPLAFVESCPRQFKPSGCVGPRDLRGIVLRNVDLSASEGLSDCCLDGSVLEGVILIDAHLRGASLQEVTIGPNCSFRGAQMEYSKLSFSTLIEVDLEGSNLTGADITGAKFLHCVLLNARCSEIRYNAERWFSFLGLWIPWRRFQWTQFSGDVALMRSLLNSECDLKRHVSNELFRQRIKERHPFLGSVWYLLAGCGNNAPRLLMWTLVMWLMFGVIYAQYPLPHWLKGTFAGQTLQSLNPNLEWDHNRSAIAPYYLSAVIMTSMGYGKMEPNVDDWRGQLYFAFEGICGYCLLGAYMSVLINVIVNSHDDP